MEKFLENLMLLLSQDIADKTQVLFIGHIILHNDNKKISIELQKEFLWRLPIISEKSENSVAFTKMTLPLLSDSAPKLSAG